MGKLKLTLEEGLDYRAKGEHCLAMNQSRLLHKGRKGQLYVIDFTTRKLLGKGNKALNKHTKALKKQKKLIDKKKAV